MTNIRSFNNIKKVINLLINSKYNLFSIGILLIVSVHFIWFLLGEKSYVTIYDNLDGEFVYLKFLIESGNLIGFDPEGLVQGTMNGIERSFFRSGLNLTFIFFKYFEPIDAYILNHFMSHLIGYIGMYILINRHFCRNKYLSFFVAICFGFLPYYHVQYGISISGQPFLLFSFLNFLFGKDKWYDWFIIVLFPFFAFSPVTIPFFIPVLVIMGFYYFYKSKTINFIYFGSICCFFIVSLLVDFPLLYNTFWGDAISHRSEFDLPKLHGFQFEKSFRNFIDTLLTGVTHVHTGRLPSNPIVFCLVAILFFMRKVNRWVYILLGMNILILMFASFYDLFVQISPIPNLTLSRMFFLSPLIWMIILILILREFDYNNFRQRIFIVLFMPFYFISIINNNKEIMFNLDIIRGKEICEPTFQQYFDREIFNELKLYLGRKVIDDKNFVCVGFHPNVAQYNGLKTLDSYQNNYALTYKHEFRNIIEKELDRDTIIRNYFDFWGSRCYAFSSELGKKHLNNLPYSDLLYNKKSNLKITKLDYNWNAFIKMNGKYLLSVMPVDFEMKDSVRFVRIFVTNNSYRKLYLYEVNI